MYFLHEVNEPCQAPLILEFVLNVSGSGVCEKSLDPINEGDASNPNIQHSSPTFPSKPSHDPPPSTIPSNSLDPTIDKDPSDDYLEDDSEY